MSNNCTMCGSSIPDGQTVCSMCYGDIDYGTDGYYKEYMERCAEHDAEEQYQAEQEEENENSN